MFTTLYRSLSCRTSSVGDLLHVRSSKTTSVLAKGTGIVTRMSNAPEGPQDAITEEEMAGTAVPRQPGRLHEPSDDHKRPNACTPALCTSENSD